MKRSILTVTALMLSVSLASATQRGYEPPVKQTPPTQTTNNYGGHGGQGGQGGKGGNASAAAAAQANAAAIAKGGSVKNSGNSFNQNKNSNSNKNNNTNKQGQTQGQKQSQSQSATATSNSGGNYINNSNNYKTAAASAYAPSGQTTAPCQKYASLGGQGINFGFSFGLNFDSKKCWDLVRAADYKAVYGVAVVRAYYEANDPVLAAIVAKQGAGTVKAKVRKPAKKKVQCACR